MKSTRRGCCCSACSRSQGGGDPVYSSVRYLNTPAHKESANNALKRHGVKGRLVAHGLRVMARTMLYEHGHDHAVIEAALAHTDPNQVRSAYNRTLYLKRRRELMAWWSDFIMTAAGDQHCL